MKTILSKTVLTLTCLLCICLVGLYYSTSKNALLRNQNKTLLESRNTLLEENSYYKVLDSLNAVDVGNLTLSLNEYKKYYKEDQELIEALKKKKYTVTNVTTTNTTTTTQVETLVHDTLRDSVLIRCFDYCDDYLSISGCIDSVRFNGTVISYDSLLLLAQVKYKRFLGFLWKTKKVKDQKYTIVSKNPHTQINDIKVVKVDK